MVPKVISWSINQCAYEVQLVIVPFMLNIGTMISVRFSMPNIYEGLALIRWLIILISHRTNCWERVNHICRNG